MLHSIGVCVCVPQNTNVDDRREKRQTDTPHSSQLTSSRRVTKSSSHASAVHTDTREPVPIATSSGLRTSDVESRRYIIHVCYVEVVCPKTFGAAWLCPAEGQKISNFFFW